MYSYWKVSIMGKFICERNITNLLIVGTSIIFIQMFILHAIITLKFNNFYKLQGNFLWLYLILLSSMNNVFSTGKLSNILMNFNRQTNIYQTFSCHSDINYIFLFFLNFLVAHLLDLILKLIVKYQHWFKPFNFDRT